MADLVQGAPAPDALPAAAPAPAPAAGDPKVEGAPAVDPAAAGDPANPEGGAKPEGAPAETPDATLARKQLVSAEKKLARAKQALAQSDSLKARAALADDVARLLREDPDALFERFGTNTEDVLTASVSKKSGKPATKTEAERIADLERERDEGRKTTATATEAAQRQAVDVGVKTMLAADESFELINTLDRHGDVASAVWEYGKRYPEMTRDQAEKAVRYFARKLETQLEAEETERADRLAKSKKLGGRFAPKPAPAAGDDAPAGEPKTLHNGIVRDAPPVVDDLPTEDGARWREVKRRAGIK
jgi:hypothetical protein